MNTLHVCYNTRPNLHMACVRTSPSEVVYCIAESGREEAAIVPSWHTQWWTPVSEAAGDTDRRFVQESESNPLCP